MILVVALGPTSGYAAARLLDCAIGGAIGILVALLVPESPQIEPVRSAITGWARVLRQSLREIAAALAARDGQPVPPAEQHPFVDRMINRLRAADEALTSSVSVAFESIQFNPRARRKKAKVQELADVLPWCRRLSLRVEALALGVDALYDRSVHEPRVDRLTLSELLFDASALVPDQSTEPVPEAAAAFRTRLGETLRGATSHETSVAMVLDSVSLLGRLDHIVVELTDPSTVPLALGGSARHGEET